MPLAQRSLYDPADPQLVARYSFQPENIEILPTIVKKGIFCFLKFDSFLHEQLQESQPQKEKVEFVQQLIIKLFRYGQKLISLFKSFLCGFCDKAFYSLTLFMSVAFMR